jgi:hypothetical protein
MRWPLEDPTRYVVEVIGAAAGAVLVVALARATAKGNGKCRARFARGV